ncbi:MAG: hypothetical protein NZ561_01345, partial [Phycisphaerae bacterium]|nr:hypothetical protein [Phycisphaerae bacterium]
MTPPVARGYIPPVLGPILLLLIVSFVISWLLTAAMVHIAPRIGFVDRPGHRKIHSNPKPLGGGVAIFWAIALPMLLGVAALWVVEVTPRETTGSTNQTQTGRFDDFLAIDENRAALITGAKQQSTMALGLVLAALALHVLGLIDDRRALGPCLKLVVQLAVIAVFVTLFEVRALTALDKLGLGTAPSILLTVLWIGTITNAFNFLDNM